MADFFFALLLVFTAGSLVPVASAPPPRPLSCEEQLKAVKVDPAVCEKIRSAVKSVEHAVLDIDDEVTENKNIKGRGRGTPLLRANGDVLLSGYGFKCLLS